MPRNLEFVWFLQTSALKCNYDYDLLDLDNHLLAFYKQIIFYWQDVATATPKNKNEVLSQPIWSNRFLTVNKKMVFFPHWYQAGIKQILDLFDSCEGHFLPFNSFCNKFNVKCNFLQYYSILSSIPQNWKKVLQEGSKDPVTPPTSICSLSCKTVRCLTLKIYQLLRKKLLASGVEKSDLTKIYLLPFKANREINWGCSNTKSFTEFYQRIACYTKWKKLPRPPVPFVLLSVRPCGICL